MGNSAEGYPTLSRKLKVSLGAAALGVSNAVKE